MFVTPTQRPSEELITAFEQLQRNNFRQKDGTTFNPDALSPSAKSDPIGQVILSCPEGRLGVEGYRELQRLYPDGMIRGQHIPNFSTISRTTQSIGSNERHILMIVCGGQTGVDQGALAVAERLNYERGGIVPKDRATAAGRLDDRHPMTENASSNVDDRTQHNFTAADGTLALFKGNELDGTALTILGPLRVGRPLFVANLNEEISDPLVQTFAKWIYSNKVRCLNVGGPRQSYYDDKETKGDIQAETEAFLQDLLTRAENYLKRSPASLADATLPRPF
jgi:hypothetical protein